MGPFSNNPKPPITPGPNRGNKLPVPDIEGMPEVVSDVPEPPKYNPAFKKWFISTSVVAGVLAVGIVAVYTAYAYVSNTPSYMLGVAMNNLVNSSGIAGNIRYEVKKDQIVHDAYGNFLTYSDPTDPRAMVLNVSLGQDVSQVSAQAKLFSDGNYTQVTGLDNIGRFLDSTQGGNSGLRPDMLTQLSGLDNQWYSFSSSDEPALNSIFSQHTIHGGVTANDVSSVGQLYEKHPFLKPAQSFADEQIDTINSAHFSLGVEPSKLNEFLQALKSASLKPLNITDADIAALQNASTLSGIQVEVWISRSDHTFQQIEATLQQPNGNSVTVTLILKSGAAALQRQAITRPGSAKNATVFLNALRTILNAPASTK